ncbi:MULTISPECIES: HAD-IA family hydrolase [Synechococcales]|uniref:HAD-IA family hydrolase n=1 Tax=unclassified Synechococcus TaxID=2626047 RepID=UPI0021A6456A|nr:MULTISPECIES: HAD-IA family hydrolase [unclassified Synechococcus]
MISRAAAALPTPKGLLIDAMGTLIGLRRSVGTTYAELAASHGIEVEAAAIDQAFGAVYCQAPPLAFPGLEGEELASAERLWWGERILTVFAAAGAPLASPALGEELFERFAAADLWRIYPDVLGPLRRWQAAGIKMAVVSNFDQRLIAILAGLGLGDVFQAVVVSSAAGAAKPSPIPFRLALNALALGADQVWHVGDSPEDVAGATAAGVACLRIRRP